MFDQSNWQMHQQNPQDPDSRLYVRFHKKAVLNETKTKEEGRPIVEMRDFITKMSPGDKSNIIDRPVRESDKHEFRAIWQAFLSDKSQDEAGGTLLSAWGGVPPERVEEYAYHKVKTVEQLAGIPDSALQRLGPGALKDRQHARDFVEAAKGNAPLLKLRAELEERDNRVQTLERLVQEQTARIDMLMNARAANDNVETDKKSTRTKQG